MPVETTWILEGLVIGIKSIGHVTFEEYLQVDQELLAYLDNSRVQLHGLIDSTEMLSQPTLKQLQQGKAQFHHNVGWLVEYGMQNSLLITVSNIMVRLTGIKYRQFKTKGEAVQFLCSMVPQAVSAFDRFEVT